MCKALNSTVKFIKVDPSKSIRILKPQDVNYIPTRLNLVMQILAQIPPAYEHQVGNLE